ncbi:MAG: 3'-5' exonuclease [Sulfurimonas sp.]|nr:3'-5' exonuclease [Sulfurimonas sp.]
MLIFLDTETTGLEITDKICSLGLIAVDGDIIISKYELVNEGKKISPKASSINHITNEMIKDKPTLIDSDIFKFLQKYNSPETTIIGHNINFDMQKLLACGFIFKGSLIDTLRVTKHLIPECEGFGLQLLRYELKLYRDEIKESLACGIEGDVVSHNALSDALIVKLLYGCLLEISPHAKMLELSFKNVLLEKFEFGKYSGRYIEEIGMCDRGYLEWMLSIQDLDEDLRYSLNYYLN